MQAVSTSQAVSPKLLLYRNPEVTADSGSANDGLERARLEAGITVSITVRSVAIIPVSHGGDKKQKRQNRSVVQGTLLAVPFVV